MIYPYMQINIYIYPQIYINTCIHMYLCIQTYTYVCIKIHINTYVYTYIMYLYIYICHVSVNMCRYIYIYKLSTYVHICICNLHMLRVCMTEYVIMSIEMHPWPRYCMFFFVQVYMSTYMYTQFMSICYVCIHVIIYSNPFAILGLNGPTLCIYPINPLQPI